MKRRLLSLCCTLAIALQADAQLILTGYDLDPGTGFSAPWKFINYNGKMLFNATTTAAGSELWISDGTVAGTQMMKDIYAGSTGSTPGSFYELNGKILFSAASNGSGQELWITDGTSAGTQLLKDIYPGPLSSSTLANAVVLNSKLYFAATDATYGEELWVTDGTNAGTQLLKDINPGIGSSSPYKPTVYNGKIYFTAIDANGSELWVSDGTSAGTQMVRDIAPGNASSSPSSYTVCNGLLYFFATNSTYGIEPWVTDGTYANTHIVIDLNPGGLNGTGVAPETIVYNNRLYFEGTNGASGYELYSTDGTAAGTQLSANINNGGSSYPSEFCIFKNNLYFRATDGIRGQELWATDGNNVTLIADLNPGTADAFPKYLYVYKDNLYFTATRSSAPDYNIYKTDGTNAGTIVISPAIAPNTNPAYYANGFFLNSTDKKLYFRANYNSAGLELWSIQDTTGAASIASLTSADIALYPNPANNNFTIKTTAAYKAGYITLTDATGRVVKTEKLYNNEQTISLLGIAPGMYIADVWLDDKHSVQRLTVE